MKTCHLFCNFEYVKTVSSVTIMQAVCSFQYREGTAEYATYTALCIEEGIAFSQKYQKLPEYQARHGVMWKHLPGIQNPDCPSYDDLVKLIPANPPVEDYSIKQ